ncbi:diaminobutyrate acetyltransferase [Streptomyces sp. NPDC048281]|uniref:diaminobutyrate acetyltransferase n=1 Tax=Streptomyces sp. NPDC048281 TaxID=3154715 RepID=UPI00343DF375
MDRTQSAGTVRLDRPGTTDGAEMWQLVRDSSGLDHNSSYFYLLWCRDFADTSIVARDVSGRLLGFVAGFRRPVAPHTLFVWQIAVTAEHRGRGLGARMLESLVNRSEARITAIEASLTPDNSASAALFDSFARRRGASVQCLTLFEPGHFPDDHEAEELIHIDISRSR